ncbi:hypothetical protein BBP40_005345 [Aspergillus hancockii]|nr:hypothetical protein BBP40_005345 [Aspergillus hancockii]
MLLPRATEELNAKMQTMGIKRQLLVRNCSQILGFASQQGQTIRGHTLVWHSQLPQWVSAITDKDELLSAVNNHITTEILYYKGKNVAKWDVVNELYLNEYNNDYSVKADAFYNLAKNTMDSGAPIDDAGIQGHYILNSITTGLQSCMQALTDWKLLSLSSTSPSNHPLPKTISSSKQQVMRSLQGVPKQSGLAFGSLCW